MGDKAGAGSATPSTSGAPDKGQATEEEREVARVPLAAVQQGGLLLARDQLIVEPSLNYTYLNSTRLVLTGFSVLPLIILGTLETEKNTTQILSPALSLRYGLYRGLQLDVRVPFVYTQAGKLRASNDRAGQVEENQEDSGIGDINFGLTYQFLYERGWYPDLMFRLGATAPTGKSQFDVFQDIANQGPVLTVDQFLSRLNSSGLPLGAGRWNIQGTVNAVKALDPGILFASVGYGYTPASRETLIEIVGQTAEGGVLLNPRVVTADLGSVQSYSGSLGLAISLNNQLSVNFSFSDTVVLSTTANGQKIPASNLNIGQFNMGMTLAVTPRATLNFIGSIGITPDSPQMSFLMSMPTFFQDAGETALNSVKGTVRNLFFGSPAPVERGK